MATRANIETTTGDVIRILDEFLRYATVNTERFTSGATSHEETFRGNLINDYELHTELGAGVSRFRQRLVEAVASAPDILSAAIQEYGKIIDAPERDPVRILQRLYDDFVTGTRRVTSRNFTFGTPTAGGGNTGNGILNRLTVDENNFDIENGTPDAETALCIQDEHSGSPAHEEVFEIRGQDAFRDNLLITGSGQVSRLKALSARDSQNFIQNPSFSQFSGTLAVPTAITGWEVIGGIANLEVDEVTVYRGFDGDATPRSLKIKADIEVNQDFTVRRLQLESGVPLYVQVAVHKGTAATGSIDLTLGSTSTVLTTVASLAAGWNVFRVATELVAGGSNQNWYKNFKNVPAPFVGLETTGWTTGHIFIDDYVIAPMSFFDGAWYAMVGGSTKFRRDDVFTWADTALETGLIQKWLWRAFGVYLPHIVGPTGVTWSDPA